MNIQYRGSFGPRGDKQSVRIESAAPALHSPVWALVVGNSYKGLFVMDDFGMLAPASPATFVSLRKEAID